MQEATRIEIERYLAGDMSPSEGVAFLASLQEDPGTLAYLGDVLEQQAYLFEAARAARSAGAVDRSGAVARRGRGRTLAWIGVAAAVCASVVLWFSFSGGPAPAAVARIAEVEGEAFLSDQSGKVSLRRGQEVLEGQGIETGQARARVVLLYPDGTRIDAAAGTGLRQISTASGKRLIVERGIARAEVAPQPAGRPMIFSTPQAKVQVLGTSIRISVDTGATRLEVTEGKARLTRLRDGASVDVPGGYSAVASADRDLAVVPWPTLAHWTFDEGQGRTVTDVSGRGGNDGILVGPVAWAEGKLGGAVNLNGADSYVQLGAGPGLNFGANAPFTVAGWVKTTAAFGPIFSLRNSKDEGAVLNITVGYDGKDRDSGKLMAMVRQDGAGQSREAKIHGGPVNDGAWRHFALTRDGSGVTELFLDGASQGAQSSTHSAGAITSDLRAIGSERMWVRIDFPSPGPKFLNGSVADVRIYDRALSAPELRSLASP